MKNRTRPKSQSKESNPAKNPKTMKNKTKQKLQAGEATLGAFIGMGCPEIAEIMAYVGFDWLVIDAEHGPLDLRTCLHHLQAMNGSDATPIVRVAWNDPVLIKRVLDMGAQGVLIPMVNDRQSAELAVKACKYPPQGVRGIGPMRPSHYYLEMNDYLKTANDEIMVIIQIEHIEAVNDIDEIFKVEGIDCYFIGPQDLAASMGLITQVTHPKVLQAIDRVLEASKKAGIAAGLYAISLDEVESYIQQGYQMIAIGNDAGILATGARDLLRRFRK